MTTAKSMLQQRFTKLGEATRLGRNGEGWDWSRGRDWSWGDWGRWVGQGRGGKNPTRSRGLCMGWTGTELDDEERDGHGIEEAVGVSGPNWWYSRVRARSDGGALVKRNRALLTRRVQLRGGERMSTGAHYRRQKLCADGMVC